jgi:hypothetical protein
VPMVAMNFRYELGMANIKTHTTVLADTSRLPWKSARAWLRSHRPFSDNESALPPWLREPVKS